MTPGPGWARALDRASRSPLTVLLGGVDAGKTSLALFLANGLLARGYRVGVVDADLGQSEIGPPTTIGLGRVQRPLARLADAEPAGLSFVGATSPAGYLAATVTGTRRMVERAAALGLERVIVDTSGLVSGELGLALKRRKIEALAPDLIVCMQRTGECEPILRACAGGARPEVLRLGIAAEARRRSASERRRHRASALAAYFRGAVPLRLARPGLSLRVMADRAGGSSGDAAGLAGALVGLDDDDGDTIGLGAVRAVDHADGALVLDTPARAARVAGLRLGSHAFPGCPV